MLLICMSGAFQHIDLSTSFCHACGCVLCLIFCCNYIQYRENGPNHMNLSKQSWANMCLLRLFLPTKRRNTMLSAWQKKWIKQNQCIENGFAILIWTIHGHDLVLSVSRAGLNPVSDHYLVQIACEKHKTLKLTVIHNKPVWQCQWSSRRANTPGDIKSHKSWHCQSRWQASIPCRLFSHSNNAGYFSVKENSSTVQRIFLWVATRESICFVSFVDSLQFFWLDVHLLRIADPGGVIATLNSARERSQGHGLESK